MQYQALSMIVTPYRANESSISTHSAPLVTGQEPPRARPGLLSAGGGMGGTRRLALCAWPFGFLSKK
jgi:hypothetical protein